MRFHANGVTDVGRVRDHNEDSLFVDETLGLCIVADGMGGHAGGEQASAIAVETISGSIRDRNGEIESCMNRDLADPAIARILSDSVRLACKNVFEASQEVAALSGMGTTVTALLVRDRVATVAHVGDSRAYFLRQDQVIQLTDDHSLVGEQVRAGLIDEEQAKTSRFRNIITRSVGFETDVAVDTYTFNVQPGDRFMLCSDGLANYIELDEVGGALAEFSYEELPKHLITLANTRGGEDNITAIVGEVSED